MGFKSTILVVNDVIKSRKLYENILHLQINSDFGEYNVGFDNGLALYKKSLFIDLVGNIEIKDKPNSFVLYFEYENIEEIEKEFIALGFTFLHHIREQPWGQMIFRAYDYDNHILEIAENMNNVFKRMFVSLKTNEEISKKTGYSIEDVQKIKEELS